MKHRSLKLIKKELKIVDSRIKSKRTLMKKFPEDKGLKLSLMSFEGRKKELLWELSSARKEYNIVTFDMGIYSFDKHISLNVLADVSNRVDSLIKSLIMSMDGPVKKRSSKLSDLVSHFNLRLDSVDIGSLKITLSEAEDTAHFEESPLKDALVKLNELIECGDNKELIIQKMEVYGNKPIFQYKQLLNSISEHDLTFKLYENIKPDNFETKEIHYRVAEKIYNVIDTHQDPIIKKFPTKGVLYLGNSEALTFGIKSGKERYIGTFDEKLKSKVKSHFDEEVTVLIKKTIERNEVEDEDTIIYELLNFIDD